MSVATLPTAPELSRNQPDRPAEFSASLISVRGPGPSSTVEPLRSVGAVWFPRASLSRSRRSSVGAARAEALHSCVEPLDSTSARSQCREEAWLARISSWGEQRSRDSSADAAFQPPSNVQQLTVPHTAFG